MNATNEIRSYLEDYSNLAKKYKCLVIFLHHTGKNTENKPPSKNNLLGIQGFEAKMRVVIELRKDRHEPKLRHLCNLNTNSFPIKIKKYD